MEQTQNIDLTRGHKEYESKIQNIEGIFSKLKGIVDISKYMEELNKIKNEAENDPSFKSQMTFTNMQMDYEGFVYDKYSDRLDILTKELEENYLPFYELYLLSTKINSELSNVSGENINDIINDTKRLINVLNSLNTHNTEEKNRIINIAYKTIYQVILNEEIFSRTDILNYVKYLNIPINIENIGRLLSKDLDKLDKRDLIDKDLTVIKKDGLGYDYLDHDIIKKISQKTVGETNSEYEERKRKAIEDISNKINDLNKTKEELLEEKIDNKRKIKKLRGKKYILLSKALSLLLIPVVTVSAGHAIGKNSSDKITEYKTVTRTVNAKDNSIVGEIQEIYDEVETTYVATILEESPWREKSTGGYIRNVTAYEYITPKNIDENYHVSAENLKGNVKEKYKYVESKETLDETDSMTESTILITETYQDKSNHKPSTKYIIPFTIVGGILGILIDVAMVLFNIFDPNEASYLLTELNNEIKYKKLNDKQIEERLLSLKDSALEIQKEYNESLKKYGTLANDFIFERIETKDILEFTKQMKRH